MRIASNQIWVGVTIGFLAFGFTAAYAASDDGVINACVENGNGLIRFVKAGEECKKHEQALSWSIKGSQGDVGPAGSPGPVGATGPQGLQGVPGLSAVVSVDGESKALPTRVLSPSVVVNVTCPAGKVALSGGARLNLNAGFIVLSSPVVVAGQSSPTGWTSFVTTASGGSLPASANIVATAYAVCANAQ